MAAYDLDKPLYQQYFLYLGRLVQGDLGPSFRTRDFNVNEIIASGLPVSIRLGLSAISVALLLERRSESLPRSGKTGLPIIR